MDVTFALSAAVTLAVSVAASVASAHPYELLRITSYGTRISECNR